MRDSLRLRLGAKDGTPGKLIMFAFDKSVFVSFQQSLQYFNGLHTISCPKSGLPINILRQTHQELAPYCAMKFDFGVMLIPVPVSHTYPHIPFLQIVSVGLENKTLNCAVVLRVAFNDNIVLRPIDIFDLDVFWRLVFLDVVWRFNISIQVA